MRPQLVVVHALLAGLLLGAFDASGARLVPAGAASTVAKTFGNTAAGASALALESDRKRVSRFTLAENAIVSELVAFVDGKGTTKVATQVVRGVIYADTSGPGALRCQTQQLAVGTGQAAGWVRLAVSGSCSLSAGAYWLGLHTGTTTKVIRAFYAAAASAARVTKDRDLYTDGPTATFGRTSTANQRLSVHAVYTPPDANPPSAEGGSATAAVNTPLTLTLRGSDVESCELAFTVVSGPANGALGPLTNTVCTAGSPNRDEATVQYTPSNAYAGGDAFTFKVGDGTLEAAPATVTVTVEAPNAPPTAQEAEAVAAGGIPVTITLTGSDLETCELAFAIASGPDHGTLGSLTGASCAQGAPNEDTATVRYTPDSAYSGPDSFTFSVRDGALSSQARISIDVLPAASAPVAESASADTAAGAPLTITLTGLDDESCELGFVIVRPPSHGTLGPLGSDVSCVPGSPNHDTATIEYTAQRTYNGSDSFTFKVNDGVVDSPVATFTLSVRAALAARAGAATTTVDTPVTIVLEGSDPAECELTFTVVDPPDHGSLGPLGDAACSDGTPNQDSAAVDYTPDPGFSGVDSFAFRVANASEESPPASITLGIAPQAAFAAVPQAGTAPVTVAFADASVGDPTAWLWDFGDGESSTDRNPHHVYRTPGTYTVTLTVSNEGGSTRLTKPDLIEVAQPPSGPNPLTCTGYPERRIFLEAQGWWLQTPGRSGTDFGHVHIATCWPYAQHISGLVALDVRLVMHHTPGTIYHVSTGGVDTGVLTEESTNFTCPTEETCTFWVRLVLDISQASHGGRIESRFHADVREPDGSRQLVSTGWQSYWDVPGKPVEDYRASDTTIARGWYEQAGRKDFGYQNATAKCCLPEMPVSGVWTPSVKLAPGAGGTPTTYHFATIDPCFHCEPHDMGRVLEEGAGEFDGALSIDTTQLSNGPHNLFLRADSDVSTGSTNSGVLVVRFVVQN